ncbi:MAG: Tetratricopeptide repeat protein [Acidobacteria bacterium]|nr:Tetratricopeptide repeat protein [Acidobacteriota bacterium]
MYFRSTFLPLLLLLVPFQNPGDSFQRHYENAETQRRAGNFGAAQAEYLSILGEAYHQLARIYSAQADYRQAAVVLETTVTYLPDSEDVLIDLAIAYFHNEQYQKAVTPLNKAVVHNSGSASAHHMLGKTYFMMGEFEKSTNELETALRLAPKDYDVAYTLGLAYLKQRKMDLARQLYDHMIGQLGDRPQLRVLVGRAYRETGFLPEAIEEFKKAVALDPRFPRVHYYLGLSYLLKDGVSRLADAIAEFKIELAAHPDEFFANYYLGIAFTVDRKWDTAIGFLQKASQLQPSNPDPYFFLGQAYQGLEKHEEAIEVLRKAIALNPDLQHNDYQVTNAHFRLGQALLKVGRTEEGQKEIKIAADLKSRAFKRDEAKVEAFTTTANSDEKSKFPELVVAEGVIAQSNPLDEQAKRELKNSEAYYAKVIASAHNNVGLLLAEQKGFRAAAEQFRLAIKWDPHLEGLNFNLGLASYKAGLYEEALSPLENELKDHPANESAKQLLGLSYFATNNYPQASALLTEIVAAKPNQAALYYPLALSLIKLGKKDAANHVIEQMVAMGGSSPQLHILLGQASYDQGDSVKALEELETAISLDNKVLLAHSYAGVIYLKLGKFAEAKREFGAELALNPGDLQAKYHLGFVLLAGQETEAGIKLMREVIQQKPDFADAHYELGKALLQKNDLKAALESLESAAKLDPDKSHVHYQLGRAYLAAGRKAEGDNQLEISRQLKEKERRQTN